MDEIDAANEHAEHMTNMAIQIALSSQSRAPSSGICRVCGDPIESARLQANPSAPTCRDCAAAEDDKRQRRRKLGEHGNILADDLTNRQVVHVTFTPAAPPARPTTVSSMMATVPPDATSRGHRRRQGRT